MDKSVDFGAGFAALEGGFSALVLLEWVQFANEKLAARPQNSVRFGKDKRQIRNMFQHEVTRNQIDRVRRARPGLGQVSQRK